MQAQDSPRPASPKYDESTFFYSNPFGPLSLGQRPHPTPAAAAAAAAGTPLLSGGPSSQQGPGSQGGGGGGGGSQPTPRSSSQPKASLLKTALKGGSRRRASEVDAAPAPKRVGFSAAQAAEAVAGGEKAAASGGTAPAAARQRGLAAFVSQLSGASPLGSAGATPLSQSGFKRTVAGKGQQLTLLCAEVHAECRGALLPDPRHDAVRAVALAVMDDDEEVPQGE